MLEMLIQRLQRPLHPILTTDTDRASASASSGIEDKIDRLMKGIDALEGLSSRAPTSVPGTTRSVLNATVLPISLSSWIIDTGATDHMTSESRILSSFHP